MGASLIASAGSFAGNTTRCYGYVGLFGLEWYFIFTEKSLYSRYYGFSSLAKLNG